MYLSTSAASASDTPIPYQTKEYDTHNALTVGTGARFTAPSRGLYSVKLGSHAGNTVSYGIVLYKNGTAYKGIAANNTNTSTVNGSVDVYLNAGEFIDIRSTSSVTFTGGTLQTFNVANVSIHRIGI
jgi:hypothetical protein